MSDITICEQIQEIILGALNSPEEWVTAARLLIEMGVGIDRVRERLVKEMSDGERWSALFIMSKTGYVPPETIPAIRRVVQTGQFYERIDAIKVLGMSGNPRESCPLLRQVIQTAEFSCERREAIRAIRKLHRQDQRPEIDDIDVITGATNVSSVEVQVCAAATIADWGIEEYTLDRLIERLEEKPEGKYDVLLIAAEELIDTGWIDRASTLLKRLLISHGECSSQTVVDAIEQIKRLGPAYATEFAPVLRKLAENRANWDISVNAIEALGSLQCRDRETIALLRQLVRTEIEKERGLRALNALFLLGNITTAELNALEKVPGYYLCAVLNGVTRKSLSDKQVAGVAKRLKDTFVHTPRPVPGCWSTAFRLGIVEENDFDTLRQVYVLSAARAEALGAMADLWHALGCHSRETISSGLTPR